MINDNVFKLFRDFQDLILSPSPTGVIMKSDDIQSYNYFTNATIP